MKRIKTVLAIILYLTSSQNAAEHQSKSAHTIHNALPLISDLKTMQTVSTCRLILLPSLLAIIAYIHKETIAKTIYKNPISFLAISYLLGNYLIDTVIKYQKINATLRFLLLSHTMNRYMLSAFAIKNYILQQRKNHGQQFNEDQFFKKITDHTGYTIEELEFFTTELIHQSVHAINDITFANYQDQTDNQIYFLLKNKITVEQIIVSSQHDNILQQALLKYQKNPEEEYESTLETIALLIKQQINSFIKKNLHIFPQVR